VVVTALLPGGRWAPLAVQQSFQDALTRNRISVQVPVASPAQRVADGYIQMVQSSDAAATVYILAQSDKVGAAYVVGGACHRLAVDGGAGGSLAIRLRSRRGARSVLRAPRSGGNPCAW